MRASTNILTGSAEASVTQNAGDYLIAIATHVGGDWSQHTQMRLYATPYAEPATGHTIASATLLRLKLSGLQAIDGFGEGAFTVPAIDPSIVTNPGGPPIIIQQPSNTSAIFGAPAAFAVSVISAVQVTYQWFKAGAAIAGATASSYFVNSALAGSVYSVSAANIYGSVLSVSATLTVLPVPPTIQMSSDDNFDFSVLLTKGIF
jgi:hypothetical protein